MIDPVDSVIRPLNNRTQCLELVKFTTRRNFQLFTACNIKGDISFQHCSKNAKFLGGKGCINAPKHSLKNSEFSNPLGSVNKYLTCRAQIYSES